MKNILLITIDSLRPDHVHHLGYSRHTTPNLDQLAREGVTFQNAITNGPSTRFAFVSILASDYSFMQPGLGLSSTVETTLAEVLASSGYVTAAFHTVGWLSHVYGYDRGFSAYFDESKWGPLEGQFKYLVRKALGRWLPPMSNKISSIRKLLSFAGQSGHRLAFSYRPAPEINSRAISWIQAQQQPCFVWLHYMDAHLPYWPRNEHLIEFRGSTVSVEEAINVCEQAHRKFSSLSDEQRNLLIDLYDSEIKYVDQSIADLIQEFDDWLIVITADHGEEFGEHGGFHRHSVFDEMLRVPLIIRPPNHSAGLSIPSQVSLIDIAPTVLDLLDLPPVAGFRGESLVTYFDGRVQEDRCVLSGYIDQADRVIACRDGKWKLIINESHTNRLFDLESDPLEKNNLIHKYPDIAVKLEKFIRDNTLDLLDKSTNFGDQFGLTETSKERLRDLGYLDF
jgi:arylsulfatase A-like enzyme